MFIVVVVLCVGSAIQASGHAERFDCDRGRGIPKAQFCDGKPDCVDGSDEIGGTPGPNYVSCHLPGRNRSCVLHRDYVCNGTISCYDVTPCDVGCASHYRCQHTSQCIERRTICDDDSCNGCAEDDPWRNGVGFKCIRQGALCKLPQQLLWDGVKDCDDGDDLCVISAPRNDGRDTRHTHPPINHTLCHRCMDGSMLIPTSRVCDGIFDCSDLSDECMCSADTPALCSVIQLRYPVFDHLLDINLHCDVGQVSCGDGTCIERHQVCDGSIDCPDYRDERPPYCVGTIPCERATNEHMINQQCRCSIPCESVEGIACDRQSDCHSLLRHHYVNPSDECNGFCEVISGTVCMERPHYCAIKVKEEVTSFREIPLNSSMICNGIVDCDVTGVDEANCSGTFNCSNIAISKDRHCDGIIDCDDGSDEGECPNRFRCGAGRQMSIKKIFVCDTIVHCDDGSDELNCTNDNRFYCVNKHPLFVPSHQVMNNRFDCSDGSDECPDDDYGRYGGIVSSQHDLIGNPVLRAFIWLFGAIASVGNLAVIWGEMRRIPTSLRKGYSASLRTNRILVLNLAVSDLLMGVYLLSLGAVGVVFGGEFCTHMRAWKSSATCQMMGVLVFVSTESSVMIMTTLTAFRLYAVFRPLKSKYQPPVGVALGIVAFIWIVTIVTAVLPTLVPLQWLFADTVLLSSPFFRHDDVSFAIVKTFVLKLLTFDPSTMNVTKAEVDTARMATSWDELSRISFAASHGVDLKKLHYYSGFYNVNNVCTPKLFVTSEETGWAYPIVTATFNILAFVFVASSYLIIYVKARKYANHFDISSPRVSIQHRAMQRKVVRLIVTDFICWIPISITVFIRFSGLHIPDIMYAISAILLLPLNSALNPILYSDFVDGLQTKFQHKVTTSASSLYRKSRSLSLRPSLTIGETNL